MTPRIYLKLKPEVNVEENDSALLVTSTIKGNVMSSDAEAKCGSLFNTCKEGVLIRITLDKMGHIHLATPTQVDNSTTDGFSNNRLKK